MTAPLDPVAYLTRYGDDRASQAAAPLAAQVAQLTQANADLTGQVAQLTAALQAETAKEQADEAVIANLQAQLAALSMPPLPAGWPTVTFFDRFQSGLGKWNVRDHDLLSYDQAYLLAANVTAQADGLHITAKREPTGGRQYTSGYLDTIGRHSQKYGRWECWAKVPTVPGVSRGLWPAPLWLRPDNPALGDGELDICECWGEPTTRTDYRPGSGSWTVHQNEQQTHLKAGGWLTPVGAPPLASAFHLYAAEWEAAGIRVFVDGVQVGQALVKDYPWIAQSFASPFHMRCNLQVGSSYWGNPDPAHPELTVLPADLVVGWVRVLAR